METTSTGTSTYSHTEQSVAQDLSLKQISQIFLNNWLLFTTLFVVLSLVSSAVYFYKVPYIAQSSIVVNDAQNSSLQSFATQFFGMSKLVNEGKKSNSPLTKHSEYLKTSDFFENLLKDIQTSSSDSLLTLAEKNGYTQFKQRFLSETLTEDKKLQALNILDAWSRIKLDSDFELKVSFVAPTPEMSLFLTNQSLKTTMVLLKQREMAEVLKIEAFIREQLTGSEKKISQINKQLADFQNKPENLISLSSKEKVGEYLSELMVRKNELKMKIAENQRMIDFLSQGQKKVRESQLYGNGGRVQALILENQMHENNLKQIEASVYRVTSMAKTIPVATQTFDELRSKSELEFQKYKNLNEALSKAEAQKLSIESRFEILEMARFDKVKPLISLMVLISISLVLSQILGSMILYITYIWDSNTVTAQSSRNVVILDGQGLDPRVVIEDSKIRFRLKSSSFDESVLHENDMGARRLTFRLFNKTNSIGEENLS